MAACSVIIRCKDASPPGSSRTWPDVPCSPSIATSWASPSKSRLSTRFRGKRDSRYDETPTAWGFDKAVEGRFSDGLTMVLGGVFA